MTSLLFLLLLQIRALPPTPPRAPAPPVIINTGCWTDAFTWCPLEAGVHYYAAREADLLGLKSQTTGDLTITKVEVFPGTGYGVEYGIYKDELVLGQTAIDQGDVGALWGPSGGPFPALTNAGQGYIVRPGHWVQLGIHAVNVAPDVFPAALWRVTVETGSDGIEVVRFPRHDFGVNCNGQNQWGAWDPWFNLSTHAWTLPSMTTFAMTTPWTPAVRGACLYIHHGSTVRLLLCEDTNHKSLGAQGEHPLPAVQVRPGEALTLGTLNLCAPGSAWDLAGYVGVRR